ncbi:hypothetical protein D1007_32109 [Hordeum vulgare]|nr:hypothetical protein D1007_32109 [Hordeum vulgare]
MTFLAIFASLVRVPNFGCVHTHLAVDMCFPDPLSSFHGAHLHPIPSSHGDTATWWRTTCCDAGEVGLLGLRRWGGEEQDLVEQELAVVGPVRLLRRRRCRCSENHARGRRYCFTRTCAVGASCVVLAVALY